MKTTNQFLNSPFLMVLKSSASKLALVMMMTMSAFILVSCQTSTASVTENRMVSDNFFGLILKSNAQVILSQGSEKSIRIEGSEENVSLVKTSFENGALVIDGKNILPVTIYVTIDEISLIEVDGSGKIFSNQLINSDMLLLKVSGSGTINVEVRSLSLGMIVKGNGKIYARGSTGDSFVRVMGNGQVISRNLDSIKMTSEANIESSNLNTAAPNKGKRGVLRMHQ